jgi:peroxiredoxin
MHTAHESRASRHLNPKPIASYIAVTRNDWEIAMNLKSEIQNLTAAFREQAPAQVLAAMDAAAERLASSGIVASALRIGQRIPDFQLPDATGKLVNSTTLLAKGSLVIAFYRGAWCPYCNLELKALQEKLTAIRDKGAMLIAISPQTPDQSMTTQEQNALTFPVLSDVGNRVARQFGLVFSLDEPLRPLYESFGIHIPQHNGDSTYELPLAATYVIDRNGIVVNAFVDTDYRERLPPETVLEWLDRA